jgi:hypothetical protein
MGDKFFLDAARLRWDFGFKFSYFVFPQNPSLCPPVDFAFDFSPTNY